MIFDLSAERRQMRTENYVESPPAAMIIDAQGAVWTLGLLERSGYEQRRLALDPAGWEFQVLRDGQWTGEWAAKIGCRDGVVWIFGAYGKGRRKRWTGNSFV